MMILTNSSLAVSIVVKATFIVAAGLMGAWLARKSRAAVRHAVLAASFAVDATVADAAAAVVAVAAGGSERALSDAANNTGTRSIALTFMVVTREWCR